MTGKGDIALRIWGPIESIDPPARCYEYDQLLTMARIMLRDRKARFPDLVAAGQMATEDAAAEIAAFEDLVADWTFIASRTREGEPSNGMSTWALRKYLDTAIETAADIARDRGGFDRKLHAKTECVIALRWHLEPGRDTVAMARFSQQLRDDARAAQASREPATSCH